ncbi:DNRLRE domain-containing protein [Metabacillus sp. HB246100]
MSDSNYDDQLGETKRSDNVQYDIQKVEDGYILTVNADSEWLSSPDRVYPVYIDPTTSVTTSTDTFVMSAYPTTNYSSSSAKWDSGQGQYVLKTGYYDSTTGTNYAFLNHSIADFYNMDVTSATFNVYVTHSYYSTTANGLWLDYVNSSWSPSTVTWNTKPASTNIGQVNVAREQWAKFNVTSVVQGWASGAKKNYGFKLHTNGNGQGYWKKVVSTTNSSYKPYLSVNYNIPTADTPTGDAYSNGNGTGYVNLSWSAVKGATGYKVWIFNGKEYEAFSVGNVTSWSTNGKKIWPTDTEISSGRYDLHQDGKGAELAINPSPVYKNSGGNYQTATKYWFRVSAIFNQGEGTYSGAFQPTLPNLNLPSAPTGTSYSNGNGTGYIDFKWNPVSGATGYKVLLFNGKEYESLDVGNVTSWTTKGKKYWPTSSEINSGRYKLHLSDNLGTELAVNPSSVYKNSGGSYQTNTNYWIRVIAYNSLGETIKSNAYTPSITTLAKPAAPSGFTYTNMLSSKSGYVVLNWNEIPNATGYKVWMYNGKEYQGFDVGNTNSWTTQGKGIWPTANEIAAGEYILHTDQKGTELSLDPSPVYINSGGIYSTYKNYWFRVSAYDSKGETIYSNAFMPTFGEPVEFLGEEEYWSILDVPYGKVNMATGNLIISEEDMTVSGRGPELGLSRTYNSLSTSVGIFGPGWHSDAEMRVTASSDNSKVSLVDEDGTVHIFTKLADKTYKAPTGVYLELEEDTTSFILTTKDQTKAYFSKVTGSLTKVIDGYENTLTYTYDSTGKLSSMKDASGRTLTLAYNSDGYVQSVTGPSNRIISYSYLNSYLTKVTQTAGEITSYEYNAGKLSKVVEPNHTETKPVFTQFVFDPETDHLKEVINPKSQKYLLSYDLTNKTLLFTQPNGRKIKYSYNEAANPTQVIEDVGGLNITSTYKYEGNNLIETKDPNDLGSSTPTESYTYDANGNVITAKDSYGTETYNYNANNDVTSIVDTEGDQTTIAYEDLDPVSETDQTGKTSSISKYQKDSNGNSNGNLIESSYNLGTATNLLQNSSFESGLTGWTKISSNDSGNIITVDDSTYNGLSGSRSLKVTSQSTSSASSHISATQEVVVQANANYSLSGLIKTDLSKANAFFNVQFLDSNNAHISWADNRYSQISGTRTWTERQLSFKTPSNTAKIRIYLEVDHRDATASGTAWFDMIQLEKAEVSSSFNPILNSSFNGSLTGWTGTGGSVDSSNGFEDNTSLKVAKTTETQAGSEYKQSITIGQETTDTAFDITLTGLSKAENVVKKGTVYDRDYAITGIVHYSDGTPPKEFIASFPIGTQEWNRTSVTIPATKPIDRIEVSTGFRGNYVGTVWFDGIRVIKGNIITKNKYDNSQNYVIETEDELGNKTFTDYDNYGNITSETKANQEKKMYQYDLANQLEKLLLANGTSINYQYDKNGNMTTKSIISSGGNAQNFTYKYDENGDLIETVGPLNDKTTNEYDANGNKIKTVLPKGNITTYSYDGTDRIKSTSFNGVATYGYTYDKNGNETSVSYTTENRSKNRRYDSSNRVIRQEDRGATQEWKYPTTSDKLNEFILTHGSFVQTIKHHYNELDQNTVVNDSELNYRFDYDERGNVKTFTSGNGAGASFKYDDRGLVQQLVVGKKDGTDILDETYTYDANGNRTKIEYQDGKSISYEYGKLDQLVKEILKDETIIEYSYDGFGNRTLVKKTQSGQATSTVSEYNIANQLTKFGSEIITYDLNGNRSEDGSFIYNWNPQDQLESITRKGESTPFVTYKYDEEGRRIQKAVGNTVTNYFYDGDSLNVLYETDGQNQVVRSYIYSESGQLLAMKKGTEKYFYHYNAHGDVIALTDKQGAIVATYEYDAWGNVLKAEEAAAVKDNPYRYAGYQYDNETGMYYLIARFYQPLHAVFLSIDPDPGDDDDILTQNGYTYANNNPITYVDPDGHYIQIVIIGGVAIYRGYKIYKSYKKIHKVVKTTKKLKIKKKSNGRGGKQARLRELANDTKVSRSLRGEIKRDINQIKRGKRKTIRVPKGYHLRHRYGFEAKKGYGYKHSDLQTIRSHRTQHKYHGY